jgi:hypothetical protein
MVSVIGGILLFFDYAIEEEGCQGEGETAFYKTDKEAQHSIKWKERRPACTLYFILEWYI